MSSARQAGQDQRISTFDLPGNKEDPDWLAALRSDARTFGSARAFPTRPDEDWRYTDVSPILRTPYRPAPKAPDPTDLTGSIERSGTTSNGILLTFVNGAFVPSLSSVDTVPGGVTMTNLAAAIASDDDRAKEAISTSAATGQHAFDALNTALFEDGAFIAVEDDIVVETPIEIVYLVDAIDEPVWTNPRTVILVGKRSSCTVIETYSGSHGAASVTNATTTLMLDQDASVRHLTRQDQPDSAFHLGLLDVTQRGGSSLTSDAVLLGASIARHEVRVRLVEPAAVVDLGGLYVAGDHQHQDNPVLVDHIAPRCTSRQLYKGVMSGQSHGVFNGHIIVRPGAFGTDATQTNKNLLLSNDAEADTRPRLEIFADDVRCSHGATVGQLDEEALFYLRSRGVPVIQARNVLTEAFINEMLERLSDPSIADHTRSMVRRHIEHPDVEAMP